MATLSLLAISCEEADVPGGDGSEAEEHADDRTDEDREAADDDLLALDASCTNEELALEIAHPSDWYVNEQGALPACSVFDPEPFELPEDQELPTDLAVTLRAEDSEDLEAAGDLADDPTIEVISREDATVGDRPAEAVEVEATGDGLHARGLTTYRYHVDLGDTTLIAETHDVEGSQLAYDDRRGLLDAMMDSVSFNA